VGVEPTVAGLQPAAWPSGSSVELVARPGIEPGLRPSRGRVQSNTLTGCKYRVRESNPVPQFRRLRCYPAHPHGVVSISTWNRTRTWALGEPRAVRYTIEMWGRRLDSHQHDPVYKTGAFLGRATSAKHERKQRKERESNPQGRLKLAGFQPGPVANRVALPFVLVSSPTRIRTWNISLEARHDVRFTIEP
jgi:hypothetical protein